MPARMNRSRDSQFLPGPAPDATKRAADADPGLMSLALIARLHGVTVDTAQLRHQIGPAGPWMTETELLLAAKALALKARRVRLDADRVDRMPLPALVLDRDGRHFILARLQPTQALIQEGGVAPPQIVPVDTVIARCNGHVILVASRATLAGELARFDFSWFIPAMVKYRRLLLEVLGVSLLLQMFGLVSPLMFQVVMDKVLANRAFSTLTVVCLVLLIGAVFEALLTGVRNYVFAHTTNRMDVELGAKLYRHVVNLPLAYFASRRVGDTVARVRELENIRNFLTGQALTAVLDLFFSFIYIAVMLLYSGVLTLVVVVSLPVYAVVSAMLSPLFRLRLDAKFARGSENQSFLVESISGIETVKAQALEPQFTNRWDQQLAAYVSAGFRVTTLGNIGQQLIQLIGKLVTVATLFLGARLVMDGRLTIGQLVAFNMLAQRVDASAGRHTQCAYRVARKPTDAACNSWNNRLRRRAFSLPCRRPLCVQRRQPAYPRRRSDRHRRPLRVWQEHSRQVDPAAVHRREGPHPHRRH
jgi:subfamily B ATP-binding cassette protein HlyB/CyaB